MVTIYKDSNIGCEKYFYPDIHIGIMVILEIILLGLLLQTAI